MPDNFDDFDTQQQCDELPEDEQPADEQPEEPTADDWRWARGDQLYDERKGK